MKKLFILITLTQIYHTPLKAYNLNFFKKKEIEKLDKELCVEKNTLISVVNTEGSITIKPWSQQKVSLEIQKQGTLDQLKATTIKTKLINGEAFVTTNVSDGEQTAQVNYTLRVPEDASVKVTQTQGAVTINGIEGTIDISIEKGPIDIKGATGTVVAKTGQGMITVRQRNHVEPNSIFLQSHNGNIELYLPRETQATLQATVSRGVILSDHPVTMTISTKLDANSWELLKKNVTGILGTYKDFQEIEQMKGAAPITLETAKGKISIKEA